MDVMARNNHSLDLTDRSAFEVDEIGCSPAIGMDFFLRSCINVSRKLRGKQLFG
eukprot:CAMPEP_0171410708 /NCGR_PEP_ID=MMETSP0880-20121228/28176_1 /TAXON_ID=67004 /ORGANISM="Thalassiosira weissflogii, Strain CCMP1336" /LENGTH=53 /DNA_ID=CAMNT_0011927579 /DNA_START=235 /DNA_END=392 /DNA_ORIENTATION=+